MIDTKLPGLKMSPRKGGQASVRPAADTVLPKPPTLPKPSKRYMNSMNYKKSNVVKVTSSPQMVTRRERAVNTITRYYRRRRDRLAGTAVPPASESALPKKGVAFESGMGASQERKKGLQVVGKSSRSGCKSPRGAAPHVQPSVVTGRTTHVPDPLSRLKLSRKDTFTSLEGYHGHTAMHSLAKQHHEESAVLSSKAEWFLQRVALVALLTFLTPILNDFLSLTKGDAAHGHGVEVHAEHEAGAHALTGTSEVLNHFSTPDVHHGEAAGEHGHAAEHHLRRALNGGHGHEDTNALDQLVAFVVVVGLVLVTIGFEYAKDYVEEVLPKYQVVLDRVWGELTVLGFLALVTFLMVQSGVLPIVSALVYGDEEHLVHLFERIHFALFAVMIFFLVDALWLLVAANKMRKQWDEYEQLIRALVQAVESGHQSEKDAALGDDDTLKTTGFTLCETMYQHAVDMAPKGLWSQLFGLVTLNPTVWILPQAKERCIFQRIRQRFMWYAGRADPSNPIPADFQFSDYLLTCIREFLAHSVHVGISTWVRSIAVMLVIFMFAAAFPKNVIFVQTICGFLMLAQGALVLSHYDWVLMQLVPTKNNDRREMAEELERYAKWPTMWSKLYNRYLCPDEEVRKKAKGVTPPDDDGFDYDLSDEEEDLAEDTLMREHKRVSLECLNENLQGGLFPGAYERRKLEPDSGKFGRTKQTQLLFPPHEKPHGRSAADRQHAAAEPLQKWVQANLLLSALYSTVLILFHAPMECSHSFCWDWRVALAVFPVCNLMILQVPNALPPMIIAVSVEMLTQQTQVRKILETMKLVKFARTAKLMQAMQTRAGLIGEKMSNGGRVSKCHQTGAKDFKGLLAKLSGEERIRAIQLKECFDVFDDTGEGMLDASELEALFAVAGIPLEEHQQDQMMEVLDCDGDGVCSLVEFCEYMLFSQRSADMPPREAAEKIFDMIDDSGDGTLDTNELRAAFERMHTGLSLNELTQVINMFDADNSGFVEKAEFVEQMCRIFEDYKL